MAIPVAGPDRAQPGGAPRSRRRRGRAAGPARTARRARSGSPSRTRRASPATRPTAARDPSAPPASPAPRPGPHPVARPLSQPADTWAPAERSRPVGPDSRRWYGRRVELKATKYSVSEQVATITLSRPHRLNAWTGRMHTEYRWAAGAGRGRSGGAGHRGHRRGAWVLRRGRQRRPRGPRRQGRIRLGRPREARPAGLGRSPGVRPPLRLPLRADQADDRRHQRRRGRHRPGPRLLPATSASRRRGRSSPPRTAS